MQRDPIGYIDGANLYSAYFVPSRVDPMGTTSNQEREPSNQERCERMRDRVLGRYKEIYDQMLKHGCHPAILCVCCNALPSNSPLYCGEGRVLGCHKIWNKKDLIIICMERNKTDRALEDTMVHELIHAYDECVGCNIDDCKQRACSEIRAASISRTATTRARRCFLERRGRSVFKGQAMASLKHSPCNGRAESDVNEMWEKCYAPQSYPPSRCGLCDSPKPTLWDARRVPVVLFEEPANVPQKMPCSRVSPGVLVRDNRSHQAKSGESLGNATCRNPVREQTFRGTGNR